MNKTIILSVLLIAFSPSMLKGHGLHVDFKMQSPVVIVTSGYSESQQIADAAVSVYSPADVEKVFQSGKTDKKGNFVFIPDQAGEWGFKVDDQKGHAEKITITVTADFFTSTQVITGQAEATSDHAHEESHFEIPVIYRVIFGLSLIFGLTGIFYGIRSKQASGK